MIFPNNSGTLFLGAFYRFVWVWEGLKLGPSSCLHHWFPGFAHLVWINFLVESPVEVSAGRFGCMVILDPFKKDSKLQWETRKVSSFCWFFVRLSFYVCSYSLKMGTSNNTYYSDFGQQKRVMIWCHFSTDEHILGNVFCWGMKWPGQWTSSPEKMGDIGTSSIASTDPAEQWWRGESWGISPTRQRKVRVREMRSILVKVPCQQGFLCSFS